MIPLYPLRFEPVFRRYIWGGRRLATVLGKPIGPGDDYAESWEIVDRGDDQSIVAAGPLAGLTLHRLLQDRGKNLLGRHRHHERFPLLFKFLDAQQRLSVQVHPDDEAAVRLDPPDLGKTEAWVILDAQPGSVLYAGLKEGVDRATLEHEIGRGDVESLLHRIEPNVGDCIFLPAGVVHAACEGLLIAEVQQASDTTFRLFDWNRLDKHGEPRTLHVAQSLCAIDFDRGPVHPQTAEATDRPHVSRLVDCDKFIMDRWEFDTPQTAGDDDRFHLLVAIDGSVRIETDPAAEPLCKGQTALLPAAVGAVQLVPDGPAVVLDVCLP